MAKRGRPRGLNINPVAVTDLLKDRGLNKQDLCAAAGITPGHLSDMLTRDKGASIETVRAMAVALRVSVETIAPTITDKFVYVRADDTEPAVA